MEEAVAELIVCVQSDDLMKTLELIAAHNLPITCVDSTGLSPLAAARYFIMLFLLYTFVVLP
jgi:hypothetical protein